MPDMRIDDPGFRTFRDGEAGSSSVSSQEGAYNGARVALLDVSSMIADAAEELTSVLSEDTERDVSEREVEAGRRSDSLKRLMKLGEVGELLQKFEDMNRNQLERLIREMLRGKNSARQLREKARETFKDVAHQYAALKALAAAQKAAGESAAETEAALASLMAEDGTAVQAALNVAEVASDFAAQSLGDVGTLRAAYHEASRDYQSMSSALDDLVERFGPEDLDGSIRFMEAALAVDLDAAGPSADPAKLRVILDDMHRLEALAAMKENCDGMMNTARRQGAVQTADGVWLLKALAPMQDARSLRARDIEALPNQIGLHDVERQIRFFNDLAEVARDIPEKSYVKVDNRRKLLDAVQQAMDAAVAREEAELDEGNG